MQIRTSSDWRDALPFDTPLQASEVVPGEDSRCARCPSGSAPLPRTELWVVKHRHPNNPAGFVRFYCLAHRPAVAAPRPASAPAARARSRPAPKPRTSRTPSAPERAASVCTTCFVEVPPSGICGVCGEPVD